MKGTVSAILPGLWMRQTTEGLEAHNWGGLVVNEETMVTSKEGVYAGGDIVTGAATVILAMGAGKKAAKSIDKYLVVKIRGYINRGSVWVFSNIHCHLYICG